MRFSTQTSEGKSIALAVRRKHRRRQGLVHVVSLLPLPTLQELEQKLVERLKARHEKEKEVKEYLSKLVNYRKLPPIKCHKHSVLVHDEIPRQFKAGTWEKELICRQSLNKKTQTAR